MGKNDKGSIRHTTSCGALAWRHREGRIEVLLIKQFAHKDRWGVPKGHVNEGESHHQCAVREVREEAGVKVTLDIQLQDATARSREERKTVITYLARVHGPDEPKHNDPDSEVADARWFDVEALPELIGYQRPVIEEGIEHVRKTFLPLLLKLEEIEKKAEEGKIERNPEDGRWPPVLRNCWTTPQALTDTPPDPEVHRKDGITVRLPSK